MNAQKFTEKSIEAIRSANQTAVEYKHNAIGQEHMLYALLAQDGGLIPQLIQKMEKDADSLKQLLRRKLSELPSVTGGSRPADSVYVSQDADRALNEAEKQADRMKDEYVSVEHIMLGLFETANRSLAEIFRTFNITKDEFLKALMSVRGNQRVTGQNPEETYDVLKKYGQDLVELARNNKLDPVIGRDSEISLLL